MNRVNFLMQGMEINEVQASLISELIKDIPNEQLKNFLIFRMSYIEPMMSKELITKTALYEYRRIQMEQRIRAGEEPFETVEEVQNFVETYYKNKEIGYGLGKYYDFVVLGLDKDCNILNKYYINEHGSYYKLKSDEKAIVYDFLFKNQSRIGVVKYYTREEIESKVKQIENSREKVIEIDYKDNTIDPKVMKMMMKAKAKRI